MVTVYWRNHKVGTTERQPHLGGLWRTTDGKASDLPHYEMTAIEIEATAPISVIADLIGIKFDPDFASLFGITKDSDVHPYGD